MTITSVPSGAIAYVSHQEVGRTPVTITVTYSGEYDIELRKEGYETLKTSFNFESPWYQKPGIDFFAEIGWHKFYDRQEKLFTLRKRKPISDAELIKAADELRKETNQPEPPKEK